MNIINLAIQVLPKSKTTDVYQIIDKAIEVIQKSGLKYKVCPFETVIEGEYSKVFQVVDKLQDECFEAGAEEIIVNIKLQRAKDKDVFIDDKMSKYE